eukprot:Sspe_Gene.55618::Locus_30582_Transcript_1_1_Confidence_1.000_Length_3044::g.55618::m.55618
MLSCGCWIAPNDYVHIAPAVTAEGRQPCQTRKVCCQCFCNILRDRDVEWGAQRLLDDFVVDVVENRGLVTASGRLFDFGAARVVFRLQDQVQPSTQRTWLKPFASLFPFRCVALALRKTREGMLRHSGKDIFPSSREYFDIDVVPSLGRQIVCWMFARSPRLLRCGGDIAREVASYLPSARPTKLLAFPVFNPMTAGEHRKVRVTETTLRTEHGHLPPGIDRCRCGKVDEVLEFLSFERECGMHSQLPSPRSPRCFATVRHNAPPVPCSPSNTTPHRRKHRSVSPVPHILSPARGPLSPTPRGKAPRSATARSLSPKPRTSPHACATLVSPTLRRPRGRKKEREPASSRSPRRFVRGSYDCTSPREEGRMAIRSPAPERKVKVDCVKKGKAAVVGVWRP